MLPVVVSTLEGQSLSPAVSPEETLLAIPMNGHLWVAMIESLRLLTLLLSQSPQ